MSSKFQKLLDYYDRHLFYDEEDGRWVLWHASFDMIVEDRDGYVFSIEEAEVEATDFLVRLPEGRKFRNIFTGKEYLVEKVERCGGNTTCILEDGTRWEEVRFRDNHVLVVNPKKKSFLGRVMSM